MVKECDGESEYDNISAKPYKQTPANWKREREEMHLAFPTSPPSSHLSPLKLNLHFQSADKHTHKCMYILVGCTCVLVLHLCCDENSSISDTTTLLCVLWCEWWCKLTSDHHITTYVVPQCSVDKVSLEWEKRSLKCALLCFVTLAQLCLERERRL